MLLKLNFPLGDIHPLGLFPQFTWKIQSLVMIPKSKVMTEHGELIVGVLFSVSLTNIKNNEMKE